MAQWAIKGFGGEIPRKDPRELPDNMAEQAWNCDLASGPLDSLPLPLLLQDLSASADAVRKAYRFPGPDPGDADFWLPLPSEFSSVVRSPLANDTLHRIYWTNPPDTDKPGGWWNSYERLVAGQPDYNLGFTAPDPATVITVTASGGTLPGEQSVGAQVATAGSGYVPASTLTVVGGALLSGTATTFTLAHTQVVTCAVSNPGSGASFDGVYLLSGTTGSGSLFTFHGNIVGGRLTSVTSIASGGSYSANPTSLGAEPVAGVVGLTGATVSITMGVLDVTVANAGIYTTIPGNPADTTSTDAGAGCTLTISYATSGIPEVSRAYLFTFLDQYNEESSPCVPSVAVDGASDGSWTISGLPTSAPASPAGFNYPTVTGMRLYRTLVGSTTAADYYQVADLTFGAATYVDTIADTTVVNNVTLQSTSWLPPLPNLDGLIGFPGGMLMGFTDNTVHFCEPERPSAWPAGYDQSLQYTIMGFGVWQNSLVVLTEGFPSTGTGTAPANFTFSQVQVPEPCISRGSIITDLMGVYYASQNGLVMLNYFGMQNQTLSNFTKNIWLKDFHAADLVACRHRAQYLAINGTGTGFIIDYTEPRMGVVHLNTFSNAVSVWNDPYTGDTYIVADKKVYLWDSPDAGALNYRWRSKQFYLPEPVSLGACQISLETAVETPAPPSSTPLLDNGDASLVLPLGVNAIFNLYVGPEGKHLIFSKVLDKARMIFRLPSGLKAFDWQCEIVGRVAVHSIELASTMHELKNV